MRRISITLLILALLVGCGEGALDLPEPPRLEAKTIHYDRPSGRINADTADQFIDRYLTDRRRLEQLDDLEPITTPVEELADATSTTDDGAVKIDAAAVQTDAVITLSGHCPGWDDAEDRGGFEFRMIVRQSSVVPIIWGEIDDCRGEHRLGGDTVRYQFTGAAAIFAPGLTNTDAKTSFLVDFNLHHYTIDGEQQPSWSSSFRVVDDRVEMLFVDDVGSSFVLFGDPTGQSVGIRGANGAFHCSLEDRQCTSEESSDSFSY